MKREFEVIIIGGSYSGLSAAMALGRSLRNTLVIDAGRACNRYTPRSHNFITQDGVKPEEITKRAKAQVLHYETVNFLEDSVIEGHIVGELFHIITSTGKELTAQKLVLATGIKDTIPNIKGFSDCWGKSIVHCPYCHGYEIRNLKTGIIANGEKAFHLASLVNNLTNNLSIITSGRAEFSEEEKKKLKKHQIKLIQKEIAEIEQESGQIKNILFKDNSLEDFQACYASLPFKQHSTLPLLLGCELTEHGFIKVDHMQKTTIPGVYACGDNSSGIRSVSNAVATGNMTGAMINMELTQAYF